MKVEVIAATAPYIISALEWVKNNVPKAPVDNINVMIEWFRNQRYATTQFEADIRDANTVFKVWDLKPDSFFTSGKGHYVWQAGSLNLVCAFELNGMPMFVHIDVQNMLIMYHLVNFNKLRLVGAYIGIYSVYFTVTVFEDATARLSMPMLGGYSVAAADLLIPSVFGYINGLDYRPDNLAGLILYIGNQL